MSEFLHRLFGPRPAVTLEITPPRKRLDDVLLRRARLLGPAADAVNVIQRRDRLSSLDASILLRSSGLEPVCHVVNRGRTRAELASELASAAAAGVGAVLVLRGDHAIADDPDTPKLRELVAMARDALPAGAAVGVTANQYGPRERVLANLAPKLRAGARFVQTNPVFDFEHFRVFADQIREIEPTVALLPMVMPLPSAATAERIHTRLGLPAPEGLIARIASGGEPEAWRAFAETVAALVGEVRVAGLAVMTAEMDAPPASAERIAVALQAVR